MANKHYKDDDTRVLKEIEAKISKGEDLTDEEIEEHSVALVLSLPPKMQRFVHLYSTGQYSLSKLGQLLDKNPNTLSGWLKREDVKKVLSLMQETTHEVVTNNIKMLTVQAVEKMRDLINSPIDGVALQAAKDILDRGGHRPEQRMNINKQTTITMEEKMKKITELAVIDGEYIVVDDE